MGGVSQTVVSRAMYLLLLLSPVARGATFSHYPATRAAPSLGRLRLTDEASHCVLKRGALALATELQVPIIYVGVYGLLNSIPIDMISGWQAQFRERLSSTQNILGQATAHLEREQRSHLLAPPHTAGPFATVDPLLIVALPSCRLPSCAHTAHAAAIVVIAIPPSSPAASSPSRGRSDIPYLRLH
ncbi:hypothetical protein BJY52DRAFT_396667 [Lactarius psammicola]|nr:hypothetical protein BJY52DRAFT_396667 [Lactarius psammicola]